MTTSSVLTQYKPGTILVDTDGHHWSRRAKMVCTRHRFISSVGDDQEKYYEQKYVPITPQSQAILEPPQSPSPHSPRQYWSLLNPHHPTVPGNTGASSIPITPQSQAILEPPQSPSPHSPRQYWSLLNPHHPTVPGNTGASSILGRVLC